MEKHKVKNNYRLFGSQRYQRKITSFLLLFSVWSIFSPISASENTTDDVITKSRLVHDSFLHQRSLFENVRFRAYYIQPYYRVEGTRTRHPRVIHVPEVKKITEQGYQLNKKGKFLFTINQYKADSKLEQRERESGTSRISFNGELYHCESRLKSGDPGLSSIFTTEQPFDFSKPMIKPTFFMDHVFNDEILKILDDPNSIKITVTDMGTWRLEYQNPDSEKFYDFELDPNKDFMITKMIGYWVPGKTFEKNMQFGRTEEGFYYLKKGTLSIGGDEPIIMEVQEFVLNGPEGDYTLEFPVGTRVTDHTKGFPEIYYQGQPGKTAEESGDHSIYAIADQLNRFEMYEPDVMLEQIPETEPKPIKKIDVQLKDKPQIQGEIRSAKDSNLDSPKPKEKSISVIYPVVFVGVLLILTGGYFCAHRRTQK